MGELVFWSVYCMVFWNFPLTDINACNRAGQRGRSWFECGKNGGNDRGTG